MYPCCIVCTGARKNELRCLRWEQVDLEQGLLRLWVTKRQRWHTVPLVGEALRLLGQRAVRGDAGTAWVFPGATGARPRCIDEAWYGALRRAGVQHMRFHDLRHSCASYLAMSGASLADIQAILGHAHIGQSGRYVHVAEGHLRAVLAHMVAQFLYDVE